MEENQTTPNPWGSGDILAATELPQRPVVSKVFVANGREWPITLDPNVMDEADHFYEYSSQSSEFILKKEPLKVQPPVGEAFTVRNPIYLASLALLAKVAVPKLSIDEWAMFGRKVGVAKMEEIFKWLAQETSMDAATIQGEMASEKKGSKRTTSRSRSKKPA